MHKILQDIVSKKHQDIARLKNIAPLSMQYTSKSQNNRFYQALTVARQTPIIAEIKLASPTHPDLGVHTSIAKQAKEYQAGGASALSFITEAHYFKSDVAHIDTVKKSCTLPILQKDFVIDEYQIYQAALLGSDALLFIARIVDTKTLKRFVTLSQSLGIEPIVEVNNKHDSKKALATSARCIAVNARNLETFIVDINSACSLLADIPAHYMRLGFSGIHSREQVRQYKAHGADAVLVGTSLMQAPNVRQKIKELQS